MWNRTPFIDSVKGFLIRRKEHNPGKQGLWSRQQGYFSFDDDTEGSFRANEPVDFFAAGILVEYDVTAKMFSNPGDERTENYITGRFG